MNIYVGKALFLLLVFTIHVQPIDLESKIKAHFR